MKEIKLDAARWKTVLDFYGDLLKALGSPEWHSEGINAAIDSMIYGGINKVEPPYGIRICGTRNLPQAIRNELHTLKSAIAKHRAFALSHHKKDVQIELEIEPSPLGRLARMRSRPRPPPTTG